MKHLLALWSQGFNHLSPLPSSPMNMFFHWDSNFRSATCHQGQSCNFLSFFVVVEPHLRGVQEKWPGPHQSVCHQERLLIEYTSHYGHCKEQALPSHIDRPLWTLSCLMHLEVGQFAVPHHQYALHSLGYFLSMGSIPVIMTGEMLKDHPMWYSDIVIITWVRWSVEEQ